MAQQLIDHLNSIIPDELLNKFGDESNVEEREAAKEKLMKIQAKEMQALKEKYLEYK